ncbi:nucleotide exchange factor GrpE [Candidatus Nasuia deltocephalinicola]|uniref:nucleotide exchange factor GrpE n=1 Tax=Candidatus Nasuia deltocephalincola TaxID=1160784 RepID=UPI00216AE723|nr:nucleotide exchange factor GrpE [Candidatus Nasuia deltocephalinicola]
MLIKKNINYKKKYNYFEKKIIKKNINSNFKNNFSYLFLIQNNYLYKYKNTIFFLNESYLRCRADLENSKKKFNEEVSKAYKYSIEDFSENLLPVIDSLESTLNIKFSNNENILEGIRLTLKLFLNILNKKKITFILPKTGDVFNPHKHLAISVVKIDEKKNNNIINVLQKGYYIFERVLRPALVIVNKV